MTISDLPKVIRTMIVTDTDQTFLWYPPSFTGERQLVDITAKPWSIISNDCRTMSEVVNCLKAYGHEIVDTLEVVD